MANYFYAKSTGGFYVDNVHGDNMPADAVEVSNDLYEQLMTGQAGGQIIVADANGNPELQAIQPTLASFKGQVQAALNKSDLTMSRIAEGVALSTTSWTASDVVTYVNYRRSLRSLMAANTVGTLPTEPAYPAGT